MLELLLFLALFTSLFVLLQTLLLDAGPVGVVSVLYESEILAKVWNLLLKDHFILLRITSELDIVNASLG